MSSGQPAERLDQVHLVPLRAGVDRGPLIMLHKVVQVGEPALSNTEHAILHVHPEVLVAQWGLEGN